MKWIIFRRIVMKNTIIATKGIIAGMIYLLSGIFKYFLPPLSDINAKECGLMRLTECVGWFSSFYYLSDMVGI